MLSNEQAYYLQTMGIHPWVLRTSSLSLRAAHKPRLLVVTEEAELAHDEGLLLNNMMQSTGLGAWETHSILAEALCTPERAYVLVFGERAKDWCVQQGVQASSIVMLAHLRYLLQHPLDKKIAYQALGRMSTCLNGETHS